MKQRQVLYIIIYILLLLFELSQKFLSFCVLAKQKKALKISGQIATDHIHLGMLYAENFNFYCLIRIVIFCHVLIGKKD